MSLVTDTSSTGLAVAKALAAEGSYVVLADSGEKLQAISCEVGEARQMACNMTSQEAVQVMINDVKQCLGRIDILVNATGCDDGLMDSRWKELMNACTSVLPVMQQQQKGHIVNIVSHSSSTDFPNAAVHNASKAFLNTFHQGLRNDCSGTGLRITDVHPRNGATMASNSEQCAVDVAGAVVFAVCSPEHLSVNEIVVQQRARQP